VLTLVSRLRCPLKIRQARRESAALVVPKQGRATPYGEF
jgi:hypothetical protein